MTIDANEAKRRSAFRKSLAIPDVAIKVYFGLFPLVVALFLSVQGVRAHGVFEAQGALPTAAGHPPVGIAR